MASDSAAKVEKRGRTKNRTRSAMIFCCTETASASLCPHPRPLPEGEGKRSVQTGHIVYIFDRAHGLHAKGHWRGGTCRCLGVRPVSWINELSLSVIGSVLTIRKLNCAGPMGLAVRLPTSGSDVIRKVEYRGSRNSRELRTIIRTAPMKRSANKLSI